MSRRVPRWLVAVVWVVPSALLCTLAVCVQAHFRIEVPPALSDDGRMAAMTIVRHALGYRSLERQDHPELARALDHPELARALDHDGPVTVTLWHRGSLLIQKWGYGPTVVAALVDTVEQVIAQPRIKRLPPALQAKVRIKVDIAVGRGPVSHAHGLSRSLGLHPGLEGLGVRIHREGDADTVETVALPEELIQHRFLTRSKPLKFVPDFTIGLDFDRADKFLQQRAARRQKVPKEDYDAAARSYFRFRTDSFVERDHTSEPGPPIPLRRGMAPRLPVTRENLRAGAIAGGRYLVAHLADNGRYIYERNLTTGRGSNPKGKGAYSIPRHAGTTYFLAELYRLTGEAFLREPIERAFAHLFELIEAGGCEGTLPSGAAYACVLDRGRKQAHLGSSALTVVALVEYRRATGDQRYDDIARQLSEWIMFMQRDDGSFTHIYNVAKDEKLEHKEMLYYSSEAALALARMHRVFGDERYRDAAEDALDWLVNWYDFFIGGFFFGEEHWTCIAAEALYPAVDKSEYVEFCRDFAAFLRDHQVTAGEFTDQPDYVGAYNVTPFLVPQNTPAGSKTESMISAYLLTKAHGRTDSAIYEQIMRALGYVLGQQIRTDNAYFVSRHANGIGGVPATPVDRRVRIDYVQHVGSAMIRAIELIESDDL